MKSIMRGIWRFVQPIRYYSLKYPLSIWSAYVKFLRDWKKFKAAGGQALFLNIRPLLYFKSEDEQSGGGHYFYQDIWALKKLADLKPLMHYDIGSRLDGFTGQATALCRVTCIDIRPPSFTLPGLHFLTGDILKLPFEDNTIHSLSCLHTIEHIGLGRYGDAIRPNGYNEALEELQRVVAPGGFLILSMPVGNERIEFNAQRVLDPLSCVKRLNKMELVEFSVVDDEDRFIENTVPAFYINAKYSCGLYFFKRI